MSLIELEKCPNDVRRRSSILYTNGFGFEPPMYSENFVIAQLPDGISSTNLDTIKNTSGSKTLTVLDFLGGCFLAIDWSEYNFIYTVLTCVLQCNCKFSTWGKINVDFCPTIDEKVTREIIEKKFIKQIEDVEKRYQHNYSKSNFAINKCYHAVSHQWNWTTYEGKELCKKIRKARGKSDICYSDKWNYYKWDIFKNCDVTTLQTIIQTQIEPSLETTTEIQECIICFENTADTMVLPCMHAIVCRKCSSKLNNTDNAKRCILCRQEITSILD